MKTRTRTTALAAAAAVSALGLMGSEASAQSMLERLQACASEANNDERLRCYDEQMAALGVRKSAPVAPPAAAVVPPAPAPAAAPAVVAPAAPAATVPVKPAPSVATKPAVPAPPPAASASSGEDNFGLPADRVRKSNNEPTSLSSRVRSVTTRPHGELSIELENGQVWVQSEKRSTFNVEPGEAVTIRPGRLGSFFLSTESKVAARVTRVR